MNFKSYPIHRLENLIGDDTLKKIATILPAFDANLDVDLIYSKKNLVKIINSFFDADYFKKNENRSEFLSYQSEEKINQLCENLNISKRLSFDDKIKYIIKKGWSNIDFCKLFCKTFELPDKFIPQEIIQYPNFEYIQKAKTPFKVLKEYQSPICFKAIRNLAYRNRKFILQMPTGSGKTRTAMEIIADSFNRSKDNCLIFWLVYSEELCEQAVECFTEIWNHIGNKDIKVTRAWGKNSLNINDEVKYEFVVGGFQKLYNQLDKNPEIFQHLKDKTFLIVVDEAHRVLAPTYKAVTDSLFGKNCRLIGLTATPGRGINNDIENQKLSEYFNEEKIDIETPNNETVFSYLKKIGVMAYANFEPLVTSPNYSLDSFDLKYLEENFDLPPTFIKKMGEDQTRNFEIINELVNKLKTHNKAIFFACSINHSKFICSMLNYLGINAAHIDGSTNRGARQALLHDFKYGDLQIICNFGILSTGFDAPKTDLVFIARPTQSIVLYSQMIGRGLRGKEVGGTENCTVVTVKDNISGLPNESNIFTYFDEYFEK